MSELSEGGDPLGNLGQMPNNGGRDPGLNWAQLPGVRRAAAGLGVLLAGLAVTHFDGGTPNPVNGPAALEATCLPPTPEAQARTKALFDAPPYRLNQKALAEHHETISLDEASVAEHYGVHLAAAEEPFTSPNSTEIGAYADGTYYIPTPQQDIALAKKYLSAFGVQLQIGHPGGEFDGLHNPTPDEIKTDLADDLAEITYSIQFLPVEYLHLSGLKRLILMDSPESGLQFDYIDPHAAVWNISGHPDSNEMDAMVYTGVGITECGFYSDGDPGYASLNPRNIYGPAKNHAGLLPLNYEQPADAQQKVRDEVTAAFDDKDYRRYCSILDYEAATITRREVVAKPDGFNDEYTDEQEMGAMFDWPYNEYNAFLDPASPVVRNKALYLLSRLYERAPHVVEYFAGFSGRPSIRGLLIDCSQYGESPAQSPVFARGVPGLALTLPANKL